MGLVNHKLFVFRIRKCCCVSCQLWMCSKISSNLWSAGVNGSASSSIWTIYCIFRTWELLWSDIVRNHLWPGGLLIQLFGAAAPGAGGPGPQHHLLLLLLPQQTGLRGHPRHSHRQHRRRPEEQRVPGAAGRRDQVTTRQCATETCQTSEIFYLIKCLWKISYCILTFGISMAARSVQQQIT